MLDSPIQTTATDHEENMRGLVFSRHTCTDMDVLTWAAVM